MPGYDKNRFINLMDEDELMCGICHGIFIKPKITPCCRQTYCADCIEQWLQENSSCPNDRQQLYANNLFPAPRLLYNMLNKLLMNCEYRENGCIENFILENIEGHMKICAYNPNNTCIDCNHLIGNKSSHNCIKNLKSDNKKLKEDMKEAESKLHVSEMALNSMNEKYDKQLQELKTLKEHKSTNEKKLKINDEEIKRLQIDNNKILDKNKKFKKFSAKLYDSLKSVKTDITDMTPLQNNFDCTHNELQKLMKTLLKNIDIQSNAISQTNKQTKHINDKLFRLTSDIENDELLNDILESAINQEEDMLDIAKSLPEGKIRLKIEGFKKINGMRISAPTFIRKISWKLVVNLFEGKHIKDMEVYLLCNEVSDSTTWSHNASAELTVFKLNRGKEIVLENYSSIRRNMNSRQKKVILIERNQFDPFTWGYILNDDLIFEVCISADEAIGVS